MMVQPAAFQLWSNPPSRQARINDETASITSRHDRRPKMM
jgi:hypothetical protein